MFPLCDSCARQGHRTSAPYTVNGIRLCHDCLARAEYFAGYPTWPDAAKQERRRLLAQRKEAAHDLDTALIPF